MFSLASPVMLLLPLILILMFMLLRPRVGEPSIDDVDEEDKVDEDDDEADDEDDRVKTRVVTPGAECEGGGAYIVCEIM